MRRRKRGSLLARVIRSELLWRLLCYGLLILILSSAECSFFPTLRFLPAVPDLLLSAVVAVSMLDNRRASLVFAVAAGLISDAICGVGAPLSALLYLTVATVVGTLGEKMLPRYGSYLVLMLPALLLRAAASILLAVFGGVSESLWLFLRLRLIPEAAVTAGTSLVLYFLVKLSMLPFREKRR
ncbi:MAG: rod shape-determining protein MreD [Clostridia bacterium]|nr:rod shape-determining protein MreD [Clostridia bacterium]